MIDETRFQNPDHIKLVVSDMDGTLLDSDGNFPEEMIELIQILSNNGVKFAVASGRQYVRIKDDFLPVKDQITILAENGGAVFDRGMLLSTIPFEKEHLREILTIADELKDKGCWAVFSDPEKSYIDSLDPTFVGQVIHFFRRFEVMEDLWDTLDKDIVKLAFYDMNGNMHAYPYLEPLRDRLHVKLSGTDWIDLNESICDKGTAVSDLQKKLGVSYEETMIFGDHLNDLEMMPLAKFSYAMENGHPDLIAIANFIAPSNDNNGVVKTIKKHFNLE